MEAYGCCRSKITATVTGIDFEFEYAGFDMFYRKPFYIAKGSDGFWMILQYGHWTGHMRNCGKVPGNGHLILS